MSVFLSRQATRQLQSTFRSVHRPFFIFWRSMGSPKQYDAIIIGSGQGANPLAGSLAQAGRKTAVIESTHIGGCCVNEGCTPTKTLIASGRIAHLVDRAGDYGVNLPARKSIDMIKVRQRKRDIVKSFREGGEGRLKRAGVDVFMGMAEFVDQKTVKVKLNDGGEQLCKSELVFINVGERPSIPELDGLKEVMQQLPGRVLDSTSVQELGEVPESLIVLGGGYIGLEFGQLLGRLGAKVIVIQRSTRLLPREDPEITENLRKILEEEGVEIHLSASATSVSVSGDSIVLKIKSSDSSSQITEVTGSHILLAAGRTPNTDTLNLAATGVATSKRGYVETDTQLQTNVRGIYALGDVRGPPAFTHVSYDDFRIIRDNMNLLPHPSSSLLDVPPKPHTIDRRQNILPYCVYTDPQLGHVGLHLHEIPKEQLKHVMVAAMPMAYVARALETDETRGLMKAVVNKTSGEILGFSCLGMEGGEIMSVVQVAMMGGVKWWDLREAVWAHPTLAESLNNLWGFLKDP